MPVLKTEFACPKCKRETGSSNQISAADGRLICPANSNHRWDDTPAFYADGPTMEFKVGPAKFPPTEGQTPLTIKVPIKLKTMLEESYGASLESTVATILLQMADGQVMIVSETDVKRITDKLGQKPKDSGELYGLIYAMMCQVDEAKQERDAALLDLKAYEGMSRGRIVVDLGDQWEPTQAKAKAAEQPLKYFVETNLRSALESNWF